MRTYVLAPLLLALGGCLRDQTRADIGCSALASYNAAASLPLSAQTSAIMANQIAIGHAVGHDVVPAVKP